MFGTPFKNPAVFPIKHPPNDFYLAHWRHGVNSLLSIPSQHNQRITPTQRKGCLCPASKNDLQNLYEQNQTINYCSL